MGNSVLFTGNAQTYEHDDARVDGKDHPAGERAIVTQKCVEITIGSLTHQLRYHNAIMHKQ